MAKMTKKQAEAFVLNPENWEIIPGNEWVRAAKLEYAGTTYIRIDERSSISNYIEAVIRKTENPVLKWSVMHYLVITDKAMPYYNIQKTGLINMIYEASKEGK